MTTLYNNKKGGKEKSEPKDGVVVPAEPVKNDKTDDTDVTTPSATPATLTTAEGAIVPAAPGAPGASPSGEMDGKMGSIAEENESKIKQLKSDPKKDPKKDSKGKDAKDKDLKGKVSSAAASAKSVASSGMKNVGIGFKGLKNAMSNVGTMGRKVGMKVGNIGAPTKESNEKKMLKKQLSTAKRGLALGDISNLTTDSSEPQSKTDAKIYLKNFHEEITKPFFYKVYPIFAFVLYLIALVIISISLLNIIMYLVTYFIDIVRLIFNDDIINYNTIQYSTIVKYLKCTEETYTDDNYFVFLEQYIATKTVDIAFIIFLTLFIPYFVYLLLFIYYKILGDNYILIGGVNFQPLFIQILITVVVFILVHITVFKYFFGIDVYNQFKKIRTNIYDLDDFIYRNLYLEGDNAEYYEILEKNNVDVINKSINEAIDGGETTKATKKIFTYVLYKYLSENIYESRTKERELMKNYFLDKKETSANLLKIPYDITFISLLTYKRKILRKYYTDLDFLETYMVTKPEIIRDIKKDLDIAIDKLNKEIINQYSLNAPFLYLFLFMIVIFLVNLFFVIMISYLILYDKSAPEDLVFPRAFIELLLYASNILAFYYSRFKNWIFGMK